MVRALTVMVAAAVLAAAVTLALLLPTADALRAEQRQAVARSSVLRAALQARADSEAGAVQSVGLTHPHAAEGHDGFGPWFLMFCGAGGAIQAATRETCGASRPVVPAARQPLIRKPCVDEVPQNRGGVYEWGTSPHAPAGDGQWLAALTVQYVGKAERSLRKRCDAYNTGNWRTVGSHAVERFQDAMAGARVCLYYRCRTVDSVVVPWPPDAQHIHESLQLVKYAADAAVVYAWNTVRPTESRAALEAELKYDVTGTVWYKQLVLAEQKRADGLARDVTDTLRADLAAASDRVAVLQRQQSDCKCQDNTLDSAWAPRTVIVEENRALKAQAAAHAAELVRLRGEIAAASTRLNAAGNLQRQHDGLLADRNELVRRLEACEAERRQHDGPAAAADRKELERKLGICETQLRACNAYVKSFEAKKKKTKSKSKSAAAATTTTTTAGGNPTAQGVRRKRDDSPPAPSSLVKALATDAGNAPAKRPPTPPQ